MLEYRLEPKGGLLVCTLGTLGTGGGQIVEYSLYLSDIPPERWMALAVELLEGGQLRGMRLCAVPPYHGDGPADMWIRGIRSYLLGGARPEELTPRSGAHHVGRGNRYVLP